MDSAGVSSPFDLFELKKVLPSSVDKPHSADEALGTHDQIPLSTKTPEKTTHPPPRRLTRRKLLMSLDQVKEASKHFLQSDLNVSLFSDLSISSATQTPITKPNTSKTFPEKRSSGSRSITFETPAKKKLRGWTEEMEAECPKRRIARLPEEKHVSARRSITSDTPVKKKTPPVGVSYYLSKETRAAIEAEKAKARKRRITLLPKLYSRIDHFFVVNKRSVIPKEEFMGCRNIFQHLGISDDYADEYLGLLEELVPDWIYEKYSSGGVLLICINKEISGTVRQRLLEAK